MIMTARSPDSQLFLKTHPNRMFRVGDDVYHTNRSRMSDTPCRGVVQLVSGAKRSGMIVVRWFREDGTNHSTTSVTAPNALEHLAVSIHNLQVPFHDFGGPAYVEKYLGFAMKLGDLKAGFPCPTHAVMKAAISTNPGVVAEMRKQAKVKMLAEKVDATMLKPAEPVKPTMHKYIAVNMANGHQIGLARKVDLLKYPEGDYILYVADTAPLKVQAETKKVFA